MLALGEASAAALAKSRTMEALVLNKSKVITVSQSTRTIRTRKVVKRDNILGIAYHHESCRACEEHQPG